MVDLEQQLLYDHWANVQSLTAMEGAATPPETALRIAGHVVGVGEMWLARAELRDPAFTVWPQISIKKLGEQLNRSIESWLKVARAGSDHVIAYRNRLGERMESSLAEIVLDLAVHGAHHRGQIAILLRQHGYEPPRSTDFVPWLRFRAVIARQNNAG
ncbi:MAG TPA: DinB family protein [Candidatus Polarisedimenticolia bacterium]|nr:DinB family protein [Candidatus Polarisedimenticolia bacterium]